MDNLQDFIKDFVEESNETLEELDRCFVQLERSPGDKDLLDAIYRCVHSIKGNSSFFAFKNLEGLAHVGEDVLVRLAEGSVVATPEVVDLLLEMVDAVRSMVLRIDSEGGEGEEPYAALRDSLASLVGGPTTAEAAPAPEIPAPTESEPESGPEPEPEPVPEDASAPQTTSVRVSVELLDELMGLVGELVLARNQAIQSVPRSAQQDFISSLQQVDHITTDLQETVMKTRMQPVRNVFSRFPRLVRDLSHDCGKQVRLTLSGQDTELDKSLLEAIRDPLTHILRNAIDHGIEDPAVRAAAGKSAEGTIALRASHESGQVIVEIKDDGGGFDLSLIRGQAISNGLLGQEEVTALDDQAVMNLVFTPGFSTAEKATNISGRGVGMDVVRTNIEAAGGTVEIQSIQGVGTTLRIRIPLTLAIIPALLVWAGGQRFVLPQAALFEAVRLEGESRAQALISIQETPFLRLRDEVLPLVVLGWEFELEDRSVPLQDRAEVSVLVLSTEGRTFGLVVDEIGDMKEIVVKPINRLLQARGCFAGATILGDGQPSLILDPGRLARRARVVTGVEELLPPSDDALEAIDEDMIELLIFRALDGSQVALPMEGVERLERVPASSIEQTGTFDVLQYRGRILPVVPLFGTSAAWTEGGEADTDILVYRCGERFIGFVVSSVLDIVDEALVVRGETTRAGIRETAVVRGKVMEMLDTAYFVDPLFAREGSEAFSEAGRGE